MWRDLHYSWAALSFDLRVLSLIDSSNQVLVSFLLGGCIIHRRCVANILLQWQQAAKGIVFPFSLPRANHERLTLVLFRITGLLFRAK